MVGKKQEDEHHEQSDTELVALLVGGTEKRQDS